MNNEYINANGFFLLALNIFCIAMCIGTSLFWGSMAMYDKAKPHGLRFIYLMFAASLLSMLANGVALVRMFDGFLVQKLHLNDLIIKSTLIDRFGMCATFTVLFFAALKFKEVCKENSYI